MELQPITTAVIMAGGSGLRLRPMTETIPKPLVPVGGESVMTHILRLLKKSGIVTAYVTLQYRGNRIREKYGNRFEGINLIYVEEKKPLGTAGGVRNALAGSSDKNKTVLIISGDAVCDIDLTAAMRMHTKTGADGTMIVKKLDDPTGFGLVSVENTGRIEGFMEKPPPEVWKKCPSRLVNTGIYILSPALISRIPADCPCDFGREFFPWCLESGLSLFAYETNGYWCDIGTSEAFYRCNMDAQHGKIPSVKTPDHNDGTLLGINCRLAHSADVKDSILFDGVTVGDGTLVDHAILCENVVVGNGVTVGIGAVIGPNITLPDHAVVPPGAVMSAGDQAIL